MVKINIRWKTAADLGRLRGTPFMTKVKFFWRQGWMEVPLLMAGLPFLFIGLGTIGYSFNYVRTHDSIPKYYKSTRIYRPDDPRAKTIQYYSVIDDL